uniref:Reverse transcriptase domain-containing protein n=1 Tax=Tanacetum cinerariifolium TaxID=118510 RepID=A0A699RAN0_TANCI|nr:reverse transcriptase domain-containing protein [Tanacetum cinerariifolium]
MGRVYLDCLIDHSLNGFKSHGIVCSLSCYRHDSTNHKNTMFVRYNHNVNTIGGCAIDDQVKFATCTLLGVVLTWWNGHVRTLGHEATYAMTWGTLKKKMTDKYCPKGKIKKLEIELWNLRVKGNDVAAYTQRF